MHHPRNRVPVCLGMSDAPLVQFDVAYDRGALLDKIDRGLVRHPHDPVERFKGWEEGDLVQQRRIP